MSLLLVAYDLNKPEQDHSGILEQIEKYSNIRLTDASYAIITDKTPRAICEEFIKFIDKNDNLYVITLKLPYKAVGSNQANDWLDKTLTE
jgi:hypothetical protein